MGKDEAAGDTTVSVCLFFSMCVCKCEFCLSLCVCLACVCMIEYVCVFSLTWPEALWLVPLLWVMVDGPHVHQDTSSLGNRVTSNTDKI